MQTVSPMLWTWAFPTKIVFGAGAVARVADLARGLAIKKPLIVTDPGIVKCGLVERLIADIAMLINMLFIFGILACLHATLTLPGVAGTILSLAMAVDANVLILERVREELASVVSTFDELCRWLGEDPAKTNPEALFGVVRIGVALASALRCPHPRNTKSGTDRMHWPVLRFRGSPKHRTAEPQNLAHNSVRVGIRSLRSPRPRR